MSEGSEKERRERRPLSIPLFRYPFRFIPKEAGSRGCKGEGDPPQRGGRTYDIIARHTPPPALLAAAPATAFSRPARRRMSSYRHSAAPHAARQGGLHASKAHHVVILGRGGLLLPLFAHILLHAPPHFPQLLGDLHHCQLRVGLLHLLPMLVGEHYKCCSRPLGRTLPKHRRTPPAHPPTGRQPGEGGEGQSRACARDRPSRAAGDAPRPLPACFASCACWACRASSSRVRVASPRGSGACTCTGTGSRRMVDMERGPQPRLQPRRSGKAGRGSARAAATSCLLPPPLSAPVWPPVLPSSRYPQDNLGEKERPFFEPPRTTGGSGWFRIIDVPRLRLHGCMSPQVLLRRPDPAARERGRGRLRPRFKHLDLRRVTTGGVSELETMPRYASLIA